VLLLACASASTALLLMAPPAATAEPVSTSPPVINGTPEAGQTLSASTGTWTDAASPIVSYDYQWERCVSSIEEEYDCTNIDYATASAYTLPSDLAGLQARVVVVATDEQGEVGIASSEVTDVIGYNGPSYTVRESTVGDGSVTGSEARPGAAGKAADANLSCPGACGALYSYLPGTEVELVATPAAGSAFLGWGGGACAGSAPTCSFALSTSAEVTATFSGQPTSSGPALGSEGRTRRAPPPSAGVPGLGAWEPAASSNAGRGLSARLLGIHYRRRHLQAEVRCQAARPCRLSLAIFTGAPAGHVMIARRLFVIAARRSARISLVLNRRAARILARRRRLPVAARLTLRSAGRASVVEQGRFMLAA
jgi:hypothetical protein